MEIELVLSRWQLERGKKFGASSQSSTVFNWRGTGVWLLWCRFRCLPCCELSLNQVPFKGKGGIKQARFHALCGVIQYIQASGPLSICIPEFGKEMSYGRSLGRWLMLFGLPLRYAEWAKLAQDRGEWARLITLKRLH